MLAPLPTVDADSVKVLADSVRRLFAAGVKALNVTFALWPTASVIRAGTPAVGTPIVGTPVGGLEAVASDPLKVSPVAKASMATNGAVTRSTCRRYLSHLPLSMERSLSPVYCG